MAGGFPLCWALSQAWLRTALLAAPVAVVSLVPVPPEALLVLGYLADLPASSAAWVPQPQEVRQLLQAQEGQAVEEVVASPAFWEA